MPASTGIALALFLGSVAFLLMFALGEGVRIPATVSGAPFLQGIIIVGGIAAYFTICAYLLSRGTARAPQVPWAIVIALNAPLIISAVIALVVEPNKEVVLPVAGISVVGILCFAVAGGVAIRARHP